MHRTWQNLTGQTLRFGFGQQAICEWEWSKHAFRPIRAGFGQSRWQCWIHGTGSGGCFCGRGTQIWQTLRYVVIGSDHLHHAMRLSTILWGMWTWQLRLGPRLEWIIANVIVIFALIQVNHALTAKQLSSNESKEAISISRTRNGNTSVRMRRIWFAICWLIYSQNININQYTFPGSQCPSTLHCRRCSRPSLGDSRCSKDSIANCHQFVPQRQCPRCSPNEWAFSDDESHFTNDCSSKLTSGCRRWRRDSQSASSRTE